MLREKKPDPDSVPSKLKKLAEEALEQIQSLEYASEMQETGITKIMEMGVAFYKKQVELVSRMSEQKQRTARSANYPYVKQRMPGSASHTYVK